MTKKSRSKPKLADVTIDSTKSFKNIGGVVCVEGTIGTHTIHRTGNNVRAAMNKVQREFNKLGAKNESDL